MGMVCVHWGPRGGDDKMKWRGQKFKKCWKTTKFYATEDIKYDIRRKAVAEVVSCNSLEKSK